MRIRWTVAAADDLESIWEYLRLHHPQFASSTIRQIYAEIRLLASAPRLGRIGREDGTRELVISGLPYIVVYRAKDEPLSCFIFFIVRRTDSERLRPAICTQMSYFKTQACSLHFAPKPGYRLT